MPMVIDNKDEWPFFGIVHKYYEIIVGKAILKTSLKRSYHMVSTHNPPLYLDIIMTVNLYQSHKIFFKNITNI